MVILVYENSLPFDIAAFKSEFKTSITQEIATLCFNKRVTSFYLKYDVKVEFHEDVVKENPVVEKTTLPLDESKLEDLSEDSIKAEKEDFHFHEHCYF